MRLGWLSQTRAASQLLGAGLGAALGLRVMLGAIAEARGQRATAAVEAGPAVPAPPELAEEWGEAPPPTQPARPSEAPPSGPSLRLMLSIVVGPERSEVFVNGRRLGLSPYLGDFSCKQGESLTVEVVPAHQPLITRQAKCVGRTLLIRD